MLHVLRHRLRDLTFDDSCWFRWLNARAPPLRSWTDGPVAIPRWLCVFTGLGPLVLYPDAWGLSSVMEAGCGFLRSKVQTHLGNGLWPWIPPLGANELFEKATQHSCCHL